MRRRLLVALSALALLLGLGAAGMGGAEAATTQAHAPLSAVAHTAEMGATTSKSVAAAPDATSPLVCAQTGSGYCLNRSGCGSGSGTHVIMWTQDADNCENFTVVALSNMCGGGRVTSTCPFTEGSGLNTRYLNAAIMAILAYNSDGGTQCLATDSGGEGVLGNCPDLYGDNGANGTIFVGDRSNYWINRYWSDYNYSVSGEYNQPSWLCSPGTAGDQVVLYFNQGNSGSCQWDVVSQ